MGQSIGTIYLSAEYSVYFRNMGDEISEERAATAQSVTSSPQQCLRFVEAIATRQQQWTSPLSRERQGDDYYDQRTNVRPTKGQ